MAGLRIAIITDIHYGFDVGNKLGSKAPRLMEKFARAVADYKPAMVIDMGDRVSARNADQDRHYMTQVRSHFNKIACPVHSLIGNHDVRYLTRADNEAIMGGSSGNYSMDQDDYHLIFFNPGTGNINNTSVQENDIEWLRRDLAATEKPTIVFTHVPLDNIQEDAPEDHGANDKGIASRFGYGAQGPRLRAVMEQSGKVILSLSGHIHANRHREINGIHYVSQQAFTYMYRKHYRVPSGTYSWLELEDKKIKIRLRGKFQKTYDLTPRL